MSQPAGWYTNPDGTASERFWSGSQWTHDVRPLPPREEAAGAVSVTDAVTEPAPAPTPERGVSESTTHIDGGSGVDGGQTSVGLGVAQPSTAGTAARSAGSVGDLLGLLFDFGFERRFSAATARTGYRVGAVAVIAVAVLFLLGGVQGGGAGAIIAILMAPLLLVLWLVGLRAILQLVADRADDEEPG